MTQDKEEGVPALHAEQDVRTKREGEIHAETRDVKVSSSAKLDTVTKIHSETRDVKVSSSERLGSDTSERRRSTRFTWRTGFTYQKRKRNIRRNKGC